MDIQAYIQSGIIERYALGICSSAETRELEELALIHPEIGKEVNEIRTSLEGYALKHKQAPPEIVKENLMKRIRGEHPEEKGKIVSMNRKEKVLSTSSNYFKYAAAAAIALLVVSTALNFVFYGNWKSSEKDLALLSAEKNQVAEQLHIQKTSYTDAMKDLAILKNPNMVKMEMKGKEPAPDAQALVYCNFKTNEIFLDVKKLPAPPDSMQYQFWAIVKGKPIDGGMIELCPPGDTCGIHKMNPVADAHAFAISLEKKGGMPEPKGKIYATFGI